MREIARPIGYTETQISWIGAVNHLEQNRLITEAQDKFLAENPGMKVVDARMECVPDGAGVPHYNVYMGFAPIKERAPPPNPRNLNEAPPPQIGSLPVEADTGLPLGWKEQQFNRGT